jgi:hypothetical protein
MCIVCYVSVHSLDAGVDNCTIFTLYYSLQVPNVNFVVLNDLATSMCSKSKA